MMYSLDEFLKDVKKDPDFNLFIQENNKTQMLQYYSKLKNHMMFLLYLSMEYIWGLKNLLLLQSWPTWDCSHM